MSDDHQLTHTAYHEIGHAVAILLQHGTVHEVHIEPTDGNLGETRGAVTGDRENAIMILASFVAQQYYDPSYRFEYWLLHGYQKPNDPGNDYGRLKSCLLRIAAQEDGVRVETWTAKEAETRVDPIFRSLLQETTDLLEPHKEGLHRAATLLLEKKRLTGAELKHVAGLP